MRAIDAVRKRPGMYVGGTGADGVFHMLMEVVGNALDQHLAGRCDRIEVTLDHEDWITVADEGPGIHADGEALQRLLTDISDAPTVDGHAPHVHLGLRGLGLAVINALSESFQLTTVHAGQHARIAFRRGELVGPPTVSTTTARSGTWVRFRPDPTVLDPIRVPRVALATRFEELALLCPALRIDWTVRGDSAAVRGSLGRLAAIAGTRIDDAASHRGRFDTPKGPIDVDVALAFPADRAAAPATVTSFVNLHRTPNHGTHVDGLLDAVRRFTGQKAGSQVKGLVAVVAVVLADVHFGEPTKSQLVDAEAREPVERATTTALEAWAAAHPERAASLRAAPAPKSSRRKPKAPSA